MNSRLTRIGPRHPASLTDLDLPILAKAIVAYERGRARVECGSVRGLTYVRLSGEGFDVVVRGDEWARLAGYLEEGVFNTAIFPVPVEVVPDPYLKYTPTNADLFDSAFYRRVLGVLQQLYTTRFPRATL